MIDVEEILSKMNPNQKINYDRVMQKLGYQQSLGEFEKGFYGKDNYQKRKAVYEWNFNIKEGINCLKVKNNINTTIYKDS